MVQRYWPADRDLAKSFVDRDEAAGLEAIVVIVDIPMLAWRERDLEDAELPFVDRERIATLVSDPAFLDRLDRPPEEAEFAALVEFADVFGTPALTVEHIGWLADRTDLDVVRGLPYPREAASAVARGAHAVVVSNHGGRQADRAIAALDAPPAVADRVGSDVPVLFTSGIRPGADVPIAMAPGAEPRCSIGLPSTAWRYADGVRAVTSNRLADLDLLLGLTGRDDVIAFGHDLLVLLAERSDQAVSGIGSTTTTASPSITASPSLSWTVVLSR